MGLKFSEKKYIDVILPPLLKHYCTIQDDDDPEIFPIFNCFVEISKPMGKNFSPYAPTIFQRFIFIILYLIY